MYRNCRFLFTYAPYNDGTCTIKQVSQLNQLIMSIYTTASYVYIHNS